MRRREFITLLGGATAAWPRTVRAQQGERTRRVGVLMGYAEGDPGAQSYLAAFRDALANLGWTDGGNLRIELRWGAADPDRIKTFAKELVDLRPDVIFGVTTPPTRALVRETRTIPIVFALVNDPIGNGFVASLAHPGGNITGFTALDSALGGKWVGLLKEIAPQTARVALLFNPATASPLQLYMPSIQTAATSAAIEVSAAPVHAKDEIEGVIAAQARNGSLIVMPDIFNRRNRDLIIPLAARYGVPAIYYSRSLVEAGGLMSYSDDFPAEFREAAGYINRLFRGSKVNELPVQEPTKFELLINMKTAKALGLTLSSGLLSIADEVIE
jgi:putative tryptophan/tyrosine transport system substrate-binding protein